MKYTAFHEDRFYQQVNAALISVKRILDTTRNPRLPQQRHTPQEDSVDHHYEDKYALAALLTNTSLAAHRNILERIGVTAPQFDQMVEWVHTGKETVTLRFEAIQTCKFLERKEVQVASKSFGCGGGSGSDSVTVEEEVSTVSSGRIFGKTKQTTSTKTKTKITTTIQEYHWKIRFHYKLIVFAGTNPEMPTNTEKDSTKPTTTLVLQQRDAGTTICIQGTEKVPFCNVTKHDPIDMDLTWMLQQLSPKTKESQFSIARDDPKTCKTPRRNTEIDKAVAFVHGTEVFGQQLQRFLFQKMERDILGRHNPSVDSNAPSNSATTKPPSLNTLSVSTLHCPILPLMEESKVDDTKSPILSLQDMDKFLGEQVRTLDERLAELPKQYPSADNYNEYNNDAMISTAEASLVVLLKHWVQLAHQYEDSVDYLEHLLQQQLVAAIGKHVDVGDFNQFVSFHYQHLYGLQYAPKPFCFAIRRPNHYPDGILSLEAVGGADNNGSRDPIETFVRHIPAKNSDGDTTCSVPPIRIPLNAATVVEMTGDRYLHGWIQHSFDDNHGNNQRRQYHLAARARQFSCFLVMVGTMAGPTQFNPKDAIILQNKDEVLIPLLLNELPTSKEFKDAVASLSPEQQRFATAFRGMQLESSVFGVCVIQLKPQLEDLLSLPRGSLTKEMQLTQDLLALFIDYQIPSDMLSFDGDESDSRAAKVSAVKEYTKSVLEVIQSEKDKHLKVEQQRTDMAIEKQLQQAKAIAESVASGEFDDDYTEQQQHSYGGSTITSAHTRRAMNTRSMKGGGSQLMMRKSAPMAMRSVAASAPPMMYQPQAMEMASCASSRPIQELAFANSMDFDGSFANDLKVHTNVASPTNQHFKVDGDNSAPKIGNDGVVDFTMIPKALDSKFDVHDTDHSLRATIIKTGEVWTRKRQESLLSSSIKDTVLGPDGIKSEKDKAFDLLDALSRSGSLPLAYSELHVVIAVTHCFENDVLGTVLQDNINPIEKVEKSSLMVASTIHGSPPQALLESDTSVARLQGSFPALFDGEAAAALSNTAN